MVDSAAYPTTELASVEECCSQPECGIGRPLATMRLVRMERCFHSVFREHRSTEASSVVAWRRRWVAFWWRTSLDGGKPRRGVRISLPLTCFSTVGYASSP
jgi:hypothetical protein